MINELYELSQSLEREGIKPQEWHKDYFPIPNISSKSPCIRIEVLHGRVVSLSYVSPEIGKSVRRYGNKQAMYPGMNLAPLYCVDAEVYKAIESIKPEDLNEKEIQHIKALCQDDNWDEKFKKKYCRSMGAKAQELAEKVPNYEPLQVLKEETDFFKNPTMLHQELEQAALNLLKNGTNISLAFTILFKRNASNSLSIFFDTPRLKDNYSLSVVSTRFTQELNDELIKSEANGLPKSSVLSSGTKKELCDAFGSATSTKEQAIAMPQVKLAGGLEVKLRSMFREQYSQERYGRFEGESCPISSQNRMRLKVALEWLGADENNEGITWLKSDIKEITFAYPLRQLDLKLPTVGLFGGPRQGDSSTASAEFKASAERFLAQLRKAREPGVDSKADTIQVFVLKSVDKARTKIVYTRETNAYALEQLSEAWYLGCSNVPPYRVGYSKPASAPYIPYPLEIAKLLNRTWDQSGKSHKNPAKMVPTYHGLQLFLEERFPIEKDLNTLVQKAMEIAPFVGKANTNIKESKFMTKGYFNKDSLAELTSLLGLCLFRCGIQKERYMEDLPYLYGQLLKVSDAIHAMYCEVVRNKDFPPSLAGSSSYRAAVDAPVRTLATHGQRMLPYISWAKTYRGESNEKGQESWRARWLLSLYGEIAIKLANNRAWLEQNRFDDAMKAQFFLGYIADFPKNQSENAETPPVGA